MIFLIAVTPQFFYAVYKKANGRLQKQPAICSLPAESVVFKPRGHLRVVLGIGIAVGEVRVLELFIKLCIPGGGLRRIVIRQRAPLFLGGVLGGGVDFAVGMQTGVFLNLLPRDGIHAADPQAVKLKAVERADIAERDYRDMHREISPLKKADDAIEVDSSEMSIDEVVSTIKGLVEK